MKKRVSQQPVVGLPFEYGQLLADVKARVRSAQLAAFRAVNKELVALYWDIGKMIDSRQVAGARGDMVVKKLAVDLQSEFPGVAGFSWRNLFYMSEFYVAYRDLPRLQPLVAIIGWSHNLIILQRCSDPLERELERALIARIEDFLRAMGGLFAFVGSQFRLEVDEKEYFIDLLLFHRRLKCLVAVELKVGEFAPEFVGKMQFYLAALDTQVREKGENPSIGIILCKQKSRTIVEYALREAKKPIGVATYRIVKQLPRELRGQLPSPAQIGKLLEDVK